MQEVKFSQDIINAEIRVYKEFIDGWEQELIQVQADLRKSEERVSLLKELKNHVTPSSRTEFVQANINIVGDELVDLQKKNLA